MPKKDKNKQLSRYLMAQPTTPEFHTEGLILTTGPAEYRLKQFLKAKLEKDCNDLLQEFAWLDNWKADGSHRS